MIKLNDVISLTAYWQTSVRPVDVYCCERWRDLSTDAVDTAIKRSWLTSGSRLRSIYWLLSDVSLPCGLPEQLLYCRTAMTYAVKRKRIGFDILQHNISVYTQRPSIKQRSTKRITNVRGDIMTLINVGARTTWQPSSNSLQTFNTIRYDTEFALENWQDRTCQFSLAHKN